MNLASLVLEDGTVFEGHCQESHNTTFGEVVFNTSMTGYTEIFTDPSYAGQILLMTYPLIGNYGVYQSQFESTRIQIRGLVTREPYLHAHRGTPLHRFFKRTHLPNLYHIDTRALTLRIRRHGTMKAMFVYGSLRDVSVKSIVERIKKRPHPDTSNLVATVSCKKTIHHNPHARMKICVIDCGVKKSIIRFLKKKAHIIQVPYNTTPDAISRFNPDGVVISNGPGDPAHPALQKTVVATLRALLGTYPLFGICLGHQLLGIALGMKTYKLKFGHRGSNHAVIHADTGKVYITSQNHGYALDTEQSKDIRINWMNANDHTVEGFEHQKLSVLSVQFHPEAAPGPHDTRFLFKRFLEQF
jgi:carbamoyl-phosphate synthase small subunit